MIANGEWAVPAWVAQTCCSLCRQPCVRDGEFVTHRHTHHYFAYISVQCTVAQLPLWGWYSRAGLLGRRCWSDATRTKTFPPFLCSSGEPGVCLRAPNPRPLVMGVVSTLTYPPTLTSIQANRYLRVFAAPNVGHSPLCHLLCPFLHAPGGCLTQRHEMCGRFSGSEQ